jgi:hypothetical protein
MKVAQVWVQWGSFLLRLLNRQTLLPQSYFKSVTTLTMFSVFLLIITLNSRILVIGADKNADSF